MKVSIIGAGNVGANCASILMQLEITREVVLLDVKEGVAEGKAIDMMQTANMLGSYTTVVGGTNDYSLTANSSVVVVTSGIARKAGMTREELLSTNASIMKTVIKSAIKYSPNAIFIIVSNPMDALTYLVLKETGLEKNRIIGLGGLLDSNRFTYYLSQALNCSPVEVHGIVIGGHSDKAMIPLTRFATYNGIPVTTLLSKDVLDKVSLDTTTGGSILTNLLGTSAWYAPGAAIATVVKAIMRNESRVIPSCVYLDGEYGQKDICIGVPTVIGKDGIEKIVDYHLNAAEQELFNKSADTLREVNTALFELLK